MGRGPTQQEWHSYADESADNQAAEKLVEALTGNISATQAELGLSTLPGWRGIVGWTKR